LLGFTMPQFDSAHRQALAAKATRFRQMHEGPEILVLPNAWDAATARVFEAAGFQALATTSAGIAYAAGYPDGERIGRDEMLEAVRRIAAAVRVPVTADMEAGYGDGVAAAEATAQGVLAAGAIGLNLEDARGGRLLDIADQAARVRAIRRVAVEAGVPLVINARTDVYLVQASRPETRGAAVPLFDEAVRRVNAYREAGADCLFIPGVRDAATIGSLAGAIRGPINILAVAGTPAVSELQRLGVARVSIGSGPMRAALTLVRHIARELQNGTYTAFSENTISHADMNKLME
jgi:2-methylisocitrate lyase-like PEP mutase family enzyme